MHDPAPCGICPKCHAYTVLALRTVQNQNECHCSKCGHVWYEEHSDTPPPGPVNVKVKPDRRKRRV